MIFNPFKNPWLLFFVVVAGLSYAQTSQACLGEAATFLPCFQQSCNRYKNYLHMEKGVRLYESNESTETEDHLNHTSHKKRQRLEVAFSPAEDQTQGCEAKTESKGETQVENRDQPQVEVNLANIIKLPGEVQAKTANYLGQSDIVRYARTCNAVHHDVSSRKLSVNELLNRQEDLQNISFDQFIQAFSRQIDGHNVNAPQRSLNSLFYSGIRISISNAKELGQLLEHPAFLNHIVSLSLNLSRSEGEKIPVEIWNRLGAALAKSKIKKFALSVYPKISDQEFISFMEGFPDDARSNPSHLISLDLSNLGLGRQYSGEAIRVLFRKLKAMPDLRDLDLSRNHLGNINGVRTLVGELPDLSDRISINLSRNQIGKEGLIQIIKALRRNSEEEEEKKNAALDVVQLVIKKQGIFEPAIPQRIKFGENERSENRSFQPFIGHMGLNQFFADEVYAELFKNASFHLRNVHTMNIDENDFLDFADGLDARTVQVFSLMAPWVRNLSKVILTQQDRFNPSIFSGNMDQFKEFMTYLSTHHKITDLSLNRVFSANDFVFKGEQNLFKILFDSLSSFKDLKKFSLIETRSYDEIEEFPVLPEVTELKFQLGLEGITRKKLKQFLDVLKACPKLESLSITHSNLTDGMLILVFDALKQGFPNLKKLNLGNNHFSLDALLYFQMEVERSRPSFLSPGVTMNFEGNNAHLFPSFAGFLPLPTDPLFRILLQLSPYGEEARQQEADRQRRRNEMTPEKWYEAIWR